jgi:predicted component of type VI protein secretion system
MRAAPADASRGRARHKKQFEGAMDVILKVIEGAKSGAKIAVKKSEFLIGRSQTCHLCAGSSAVSRKHCAIIRTDSRVAIKDLDSRNGTYVNGQKIAAETELASGDEIIVGPLKFLITISPGITNTKRPEVKTVADAVTRTAEVPPLAPGDDDISKWLLGPDLSALTETQTIRMDDTNAVKVQKTPADEQAGAEPAEGAEAETKDLPAASEAGESKIEGKPAPGKLPKFSQKPASKDSREAAAEALRAWSRRR